MQIRTQIFEYLDKQRVENSCDEHEVICAENGNKVALIGEEMDVYHVLDDCFVSGHYHCDLEGDTLLVNL